MMKKPAILNKIRDRVYCKYNGLCAYSGTTLEDDWQVDHIISKSHGGTDEFENLVPAQRIINHYKRGLWLEQFRTLWLGKLHLRLMKLPKCPKVEKSIKRKDYLLKVSSYFDITPDVPFSGVFYMERIGGVK